MLAVSESTNMWPLGCVHSATADNVNSYPRGYSVVHTFWSA